MVLNNAPDPRRLRRSARINLVLAIIFWVIFVLALLGTLVAVTRPQGLESDPDAAYIAGVIIGRLLLLGVPLALAITFTVRQSTRRWKATAIEREAAIEREISQLD